MKYVIGIDLGTTNSALAYAEIRLDAGPFDTPEVRLMDIPQLVNPGEVRDEPLLPSSLYVPGATDFPAGSLALPWDAEPPFVTGRLAQKRGVENAGRLVASAKSWLSHAGVDRTAPILPWNAPEGVPKLSPVYASSRYLDHLRRAWAAKMADARAGLMPGEVAEKGTRIDTLQVHALWQNCRVAKEKLLAPGARAKEQPVTILGKGTGLVGGTIKATLRREDVDRVLGEGFFPHVSSSEMPQRQRRMGLQEIGLPYAADAGITKHMAQFLRQQASPAEHERVRRGPSGLAAPTHVLFNGGVLHAGLISDRLIERLATCLTPEGFGPVE